MRRKSAANKTFVKLVICEGARTGRKANGESKKSGTKKNGFWGGLRRV